MSAAAALLHQLSSCPFTTLYLIAPGLSDGASLEGEAAQLLTRIVAGAFVNAGSTEQLVRQTIEERPLRAKAYVS